MGNVNEQAGGYWTPEGQMLSFPPLGGMTQEPYCQHGGDEQWPMQNWSMLCGVTRASVDDYNGRGTPIPSRGLGSSCVSPLKMAAVPKPRVSDTGEKDQDEFKIVAGKRRRFTKMPGTDEMIHKAKSYESKNQFEEFARHRFSAPQRLP